VFDVGDSKNRIIGLRFRTGTTRRKEKKRSLAFVEQTQCGKIGPVIVLEEQGLAVQGVYGEMISAVCRFSKQGESEATASSR
jgi:hypothetical protein